MTALIVALGGTATAATTLINSSKQIKAGSIQKSDISKKARKALKGNRGKQGLPGSAGAPGAAGAKGDQGAPGAPGSAIAYAHVLGDDGTAALDGARTKGITDVKNNGTGFFCLYGNFTPVNAQATVDYTNASGFEYVQNVGLTGVTPQVAGCPAGNAPPVAIVLIRAPDDSGSLRNADFYISFN